MSNSHCYLIRKLSQTVNVSRAKGTYVKFVYKENPDLMGYRVKFKIGEVDSDKEYKTKIWRVISETPFFQIC